MLRSGTFSAFALAALLSAGSAGCSASTVPSREVDSPEDFARSATWLVDPGTRDDTNRYSSVARVKSSIPGSPPRYCSGILVDRRVILTAGHCVCRFDPPSPGDALLPEKPMAPMRAGVRRRADVLRDLSDIKIINSRSSCAHSADVAMDVYGKPDAGPPLENTYHGKVLVYPDIELIRGSTPKYPIRFWNNGDLAVVLPDEPVSLDFQPVTLSDSEVNEGDAFIVAGYGPGGSATKFGLRQFGGNKVARRITYETGTVLFSAIVPVGFKSSTAAFTLPGDSGGACLKGGNPNVLIGVISLGLETYSGTVVSFCTSIYPYREWLLEIIRQVNGAADGGVGVRYSDAGVNLRNFDAGSAPPVPPAGR